MDQVYEIQAETLRALGNPRRLEILHLLSSGPLEVSALVERLGINQSGVSQHLAVMRAVGLVERVREGPGVRYRLADPDYVMACRLMHGAIKRRLTRLADASAALPSDNDDAPASADADAPFEPAAIGREVT